MIVIRGEIELEPVDEAVFCAAVAPLVTLTRSRPGCSQYGFWRDPDQAGRFLVIEEWADQGSLDAHVAGPDLAAYRSAVAAIEFRRVSIERYDVAAKTVLR